MRTLLLLVGLVPVTVAFGCGGPETTMPTPPPDPDPAAHAQARPPADPEDIALSEARQALDRGASPDQVVEATYGLTRMHVAARSGHARLLRFLIERGGDIEVPNTGGPGTGGESPLHWAATGEVVDVLKDHGADLEAPGAAGQPPLVSTAFRNRPSALARLVELGGDVNARENLLGNPAVAMACVGLNVDYGDPALNRHEERMRVVEYLAAHGADVNLSNHDGETALHHAAKYNARFVALLLRLGADPTIRNIAGKLPIDLGRELDQDEAVTLLERASKR